MLNTFITESLSYIGFMYVVHIDFLVHILV